MDLVEAKHLVSESYQAALRRTPREDECAAWAEKLLAGTPAATLLSRLRGSEEYKRRIGVRSQVPPGHYHSPIVDPATVASYHARELAQGLENLAHIQYDMAGMGRLWNSLQDHVSMSPFPDKPVESARFYIENENYPFGDAAVLRALIAHLRPARIIEIGSGNSTACMLDTLDEFQLPAQLTCIEPYPDRLEKLLRPQDAERVRLLRSLVQDIDLDCFKVLQRGDILFVDSTHVMKTGSDVHFELFHILPMLNDGVIIHFHDCPFPFEYPSPWIFEKNWSWNEIYALRAF
jgi:predicted O-methyltransferase YrrM